MLIYTFVLVIVLPNSGSSCLLGNIIWDLLLVFVVGVVLICCSLIERLDVKTKTR